LVLVFFAVLVLVGVAGTVAGAKSSSHPRAVDKAAEGRLEADENWGKSSYRLDARGESYRFVRPAEDGTEARFKVDVPENGDYAVYARWPEVKGLNASVPVGVETGSGLEWTKVNQQRDGGRWVRLGVFGMTADDDNTVRFSPQTDGEGYVAADAVRVVKVSSDAAPSKKKPPESEGSAGSKGQDVVKEARNYTGVPYRLGRASRSGTDCSGLTMLVYRKFGVSLPHDVEKQYRYGSRVQGEPKAGDLVFFDEHGRGISHSGIATGRGTIVHASDYWNKVTETKIQYIRGYKGARRLL